MRNNKKIGVVILAAAVGIAGFISIPNGSYAAPIAWPDYRTPLILNSVRVDMTQPLIVEVSLPESILSESKRIGLLIDITTDSSLDDLSLVVNKRIFHRYSVRTRQVMWVDPKLLHPGINELRITGMNDTAGIHHANGLRFEFEKGGLAKVPAVTKQEKRRDNKNPAIMVTKPDIQAAEQLHINEDAVTIEGKVLDDSGIVYVHVNGQEANLDAEGNFQRKLFLAVGDNAIQIEAMDREGNKGRLQFTIQRPEVRAQAPTKIEPTPKPAPESTQLPEIGQRWALVIGISNYQDSRIPSLRYAAHDAKAFAGWLESQQGGRYPPARVKMLLDSEATFAKMRDSLFVWLQNAIEEDVVTIFFAGHGSPDSPDTPENLFLLPYDAIYDNIATSGFPMWDIETALKRFIRARKVVIITDACHSGGVGNAFDIARRSKTDTRNVINTGLQNLAAVSDGVCVISASSDEQFSQEGRRWGGGHGVFTYFLVNGLKGEADYNRDKRVTLGELIPYVSEQVRRETRSAQSPMVSGKFDPALSIAK